MTRYQALLHDAKTRIRETSIEALRAGDAAGLLIDTREPAEPSAEVHAPPLATMLKSFRSCAVRTII